MIDYVIMDCDIDYLIKKLEIPTRIESDHMPLEITLDVQIEEDKPQTRISWHKQNICRFRKFVENAWLENSNYEQLNEVIRAAIGSLSKTETKKNGIWFDEECVRVKSDTRKALKKYKRNEITNTNIFIEIKCEKHSGN